MRLAGSGGSFAKAEGPKEVRTQFCDLGSTPCRSPLQLRSHAFVPEPCCSPLDRLGARRLPLSCLPRLRASFSSAVCGTEVWLFDGYDFQPSVRLLEMCSKGHKNPSGSAAIRASRRESRYFLSTQIAECSLKSAPRPRWKHPNPTVVLADLLLPLPGIVQDVRSALASKADPNAGLASWPTYRKATFPTPPPPKPFEACSTQP